MNVDQILKLVSHYTNVSVEDMKSASHSKTFASARFIAAKMLKEHTILSLRSIGDLLGGRNHSTMINCLKRFDDECDTDKAFRGIVSKIRNDIGYYTRNEGPFCRPCILPDFFEPSYINAR